ncbi:MAG: DUF1156 domain-containing protein, partial [Chloroflexi bacterium]|nr:DUF1156 domain-containing protein [Chloroflexota bacterium]
ATLLPDPGDPEKRRELCENIAGTVEKVIEKKKKMPDGSPVEREKEVTKGGILHWGRETENADTLEWFRKEIRKAYGGRAPKVLDPFAGGGAIPLEAMRLGCEATAIDINPVAWFILKCTLEYPQKLAGQTRPLPEFILKDREFMQAFLKSKGLSKAQIQRRLEKLGHLEDQMALDKLELAEGDLEADLAWHVRAWGRWVLDHARRELAQFYPTYADFEPIQKNLRPFETQPMRLVPLKKDGTPDMDAPNREFSPEYLAIETNPRWVAKPTVAYLWARTATCKNCRATIPLLKTRWICKKDNKRVLLMMEPKPDRTGVLFGVQKEVPAVGGNSAQKKATDKKLGAGTMSRSGAKCPCCSTILTMQDIRLEGQAGRLGTVMTAVVANGPDGKEYRRPTDEDVHLAVEAEHNIERVFSNMPFGILTEPLASKEALGFRAPLYGIDHWRKLFTPRQLLALGTVLNETRHCLQNIPSQWREPIAGFLALAFDRLADRNSMLCWWQTTAEKVAGTFTRFALPMTWDFNEINPLADSSGGYVQAIEWEAEYVEHALRFGPVPKAEVCQRSATKPHGAGEVDVIVTDPPYYDAIPYSDLMDFFNLWLRRTLHGVSPELDAAFREPLAPKWDHEKNDGELIDDSSRHNGDSARSKSVYEDGMFRAFQACHQSLRPEGRLVVVFAHKQPDAWETLVSAIIRAGFVVDGSWPIQTERAGRIRANSSAALSSSVWLVCKKRDAAARAGWDKDVIEQMRTNIRARLNEYWDAGIRGPDFVWAATGPALEAYSQHPAVLKANQPKERMAVSEFLTHVRRLVVDYIVGQVLSGDQSRGQEISVTDRLDEVTAYYLLHRHDFGFKDAPAGACILYAVSCGLSDRELVGTWDLLNTTGTDKAIDEAEDEDENEDENEGGAPAGGTVKLKTWAQRKGKSLGYEAPAGKPVPLIDRIHRLMHLWREGDLHKVDEYLDEHGLRRHELFKRLLQSIIELSEAGGEERSLLESLSNHLGIKGAVKDDKQTGLAFQAPE